MGISADLVVRVGASLDDFRREMARGPEIAQRFAADVTRGATRAFAPPRLDVAAYTRAGTRAGEAFAAGATAGTSGGAAFAGLQDAATRAATAVAAVFTVGGAIQAADAWQASANALRLVAGSAEQAAAVQARLFQVAQDTRTEFGATASLYTTLTRASRELGASQADVLRATTVVAQSFAVSGASAQETAASIRQLGQALASGVLRGDEFNSIAEQAPRLAQAIADMAGVSVGGLRKMAEAGQLTSKLVFGALLGQADQIGAEFGQLAPTIGGAFTQLTNAVERFVGTTSQATGAGAALSTTLSLVATHFETVADAALLVGASVGLRRLAPVVLEMAAALQTATTAGAAEAALAARAAAAGLTRAQASRAVALAKQEEAAATLAALRVEQAEIGGAVRRAAVAAASAQAAGLQVRSTAAYQALVQRQIAITGELVAAENALTATRVRLGAATAAQTAAQAGLSAATTTGAAGSTAAGLASRGFAGAVALLGGPVTAAATAAVVALYGAYRLYAHNVSVAREETDAFVRSLDQGTDLQVAAARATAEARLQTALAARAGPIRFDRGGLPAIDAEIARQRALVAALGQVQASRAAAAAAQRGTPQQEIDAEITRLGKLRDAGIATGQEYQQISARVRALRGELQTLNATPQTDRTQDRRIAIQKQIDELTKKTDAQRAIELQVRLQTKDANAQIRALQDQAHQSVIELQVAVEGGALPGTTTRELADIQKQYDAIGARLQANQLHQRGGLLTTAQENALLAERRKLLTAMGTEMLRGRQPLVQPVRLRFEGGDEFTGPLLQVVERTQDQITKRLDLGEILTRPMVESMQRASRELESAQVDATFAKAFGTGAEQQQAQAALDQTSAAYQRARQAAIRYAAALPSDQQAAFWKRIGLEAKDAETTLQRFSARASALADATHGILGIAEAFGHVNEAARRTVTGIADTIAAAGRAATVLEKLQKVNPTAGIGSLFSSLEGIGSVIGVIGGAVGLISGLFNRGPSATERALKSNEAALNRLSQEMGAFRVTLGSVGQVQAAAQTLANNRQLVTTLDVPYFTDNGEAFRLLQAQLRDMGLTFGQLNAMAEQFDITLINEKGRLIGSAFQQLADVLALQREKMLQLDASIAGITDRLAQRADIFDVGDDPARQFADQIAALAQVAPTIASIFQGLDVTTSGGRDAAEQAIRSLFDQVTSGNGAALALLKDTGFASVDEFTRFLLGADHALDAFAQQTDTATQALTSLGNVPEAFKRSLDLLRFTAMAPRDATPSVPAPVPLAAVPSALPTGVLAGANGAGAGTTAATPLLVQRFERGAIQITGTDLTGDEIVDAWERTMRRRATQAAGAGAPLARAWEGL